MAEVKITTEVAGRVCAIAASASGSLGDGDDVLLIEAMKMEIPVPRLPPERSHRFSSASTMLSPRGRPSRFSKHDLRNRSIFRGKLSDRPAIRF